MAKPVKTISSSNSDGQSVSVKPGSNTQQGVTELQGVNDVSAQTEQRNTAQKDLPANESKGEINWLGSSYAGQDIKVIAHLYDDGSNDNKSRTKELEKELEYSELLKQGASNLAFVYLAVIANEPTFDKRRAAFIKTLALPQSEQSERVIKYLSSQVLYDADLSSFIGRSKIHAKLQSIKTNTDRDIETLRARIKEMQSLDTSGSSTIALGTLQTLSIQSFRPKFAVRALGHTYAKAYTRGDRTLAGSMIFTIFEEHPLSKLIRAMGKSKRWNSPEVATLLPDQIPPVDLTIVFANEYGAISEQRLYGVEFLNDSSTYSAENLLSEQVMQFVCRDVDVLTSKGRVRLSRLQQFSETDPEFTGSRLYNESDYQHYLERLGVRRRLTNR
jgi:hypothetical protein